MAKIAQATRTKVLAVEAESVIDLSFLGKDSPISMLIEPQVAGTVLLRGVPGDDQVNIGQGITLNIIFNKNREAILPLLQSTGGSVNVNLIIAVERRDP